MKPTGQIDAGYKGFPTDAYPVPPHTSFSDHLSFLFHHIHIAAVPGEAASD
jgi:hypothetical protein